MKNTLSMLMVCLWQLSAIAQSGRYHVVISEIMANPSSSDAVNAVKYIELYNRSATTINLQHWTVSDGRVTAIIRTMFLLQPDSFVVLCATSNATQLQTVAQVIGVGSFPTLRINGDELVVRSPEGSVVHAVAYDKTWYGNEVKSNGGWSLEMIDPQYPCIGSGNWAASTDPARGTPGRKNSVSRSNPDRTPPIALQAVADKDHVTIRFNESLDSSLAVDIRNYTIPGAVITRATIAPPFFNHVTLVLASPVVANNPYTINIQNVKDCAGNSLLPITLPFGEPVTPQAGDIVFNEILFHPRDGGTDYIELYNRSERILNLKDLLLTNRSSAGNPGPLRQISTEDHLLFPGDYLLLSENTEVVQQQYAAQNPIAFLQMEALPSMPNTAGHIQLFNADGEIIDGLQYEDKWHFPLVAHPKGVALERISPDKPTQERNNWHSAAASAGYGTPGYQNSQFVQIPVTAEEISIAPKVFSPDNDGWNDFLTISYRFAEPGNVCSIRIFDTHGRLINHLVRNALCGQEGYFRWNGLDANDRALRVGIYVVHIEIFHPGGKTRQLTRAVTLARRF